jgi:hypothetical protein
MKRGIVLLLGLLVAGAYANSAFASTATWQDPNGWVKICKFSAAAPLAVTGNFSFTVTDANGDHSATVAVGSCSLPIHVVAGTVTVTEALHPWYQVTSITSLPGSTYLTDFDLTDQTATLNVAASGDQSGTAVVNYTDQLVDGNVEICKNAADGAPLAGSWTYTLGGDGYANVDPTDGLVTSVTSQLGSCSQSTLVPAGDTTIQEQPVGGVDVTEIDATTNAGTTGMIYCPDALAKTCPAGSDSGDGSVAAGFSTVLVNAGDASKQTLVTYWDDVVTLEVCKVWRGDSASPVSAYPFTFSASGDPGTTGPAPLTSANIAPGSCITVGQYRAGTQVTVTEGVVPGTKVASIAASPANYSTTVTPNPNLAHRTVVVNMTGNGTNGDTIVTFTDVRADPGVLKICKYAGTPAPIGTSFNFTWSANGGPANVVSVPLGGCSQPRSVPFNSTVTVTELPSTGNSVSNIAVVPQFLVIGGLGTTDIPVIVTAPNLTAGTVSVLIGEDNTTEVDYTDIDPPGQVSTPPSSTPPSSGTGSTGSTAPTGSTGSTAPTASTGSTASSGSSGGGGGGGGGGGSSSSPSSSSSSTPAITPVSTGTAVGAALTPPSVKVTTGTTAKTKAQLQKALKLQQLKTQLSNLKLTGSKLAAKLHATSKHSKQHKHLQKQLTDVRSREAKLSLEIHLLEK